MSDGPVGTPDSPVPNLSSARQTALSSPMHRDADCVHPLPLAAPSAPCILSLRVRVRLLNVRNAARSIPTLRPTSALVSSAARSSSSLELEALLVSATLAQLLPQNHRAARQSSLQTSPPTQWQQSQGTSATTSSLRSPPRSPTEVSPAAQRPRTLHPLPFTLDL